MGNVTTGGNVYTAAVIGNDTTATPAKRLLVEGDVVDGASAVAVKIGNKNALATSGAKIAGFYSDAGTTEVARVDKNGQGSFDGGVVVGGLTSGRVVVAGTSGLLGDDVDLTFATDTLTATKMVGSTSVCSPLHCGGSASGGGVIVQSTSNATKGPVSLDGRHIVAPAKTLTHDTATGLFEVSLADLSAASGQLWYAVQVTNGTDAQAHSGCAWYAAVRKGNTITAVITDESTGDAAYAETDGSLTISEELTIATDYANNKFTIKFKFTSNLGGTPVYKCYFDLHNSSASTITLL
jgi:hypothetical protein